MKEINKKIKIWWYILVVKHFSMDKKLKEATLRFSLPKDNPQPDGSFKIIIGDMLYYFEGQPKKTEYISAMDEERSEYEYKYGGWEIDMTK